MPVQLTYEIDHVAEVEGAVVDGQLKNIKSGAAVGIVPFGKFVVESNGKLFALPTTTGQVTSGLVALAIRQQADVANANDVLQYEDESDISALDHGVVYVVTEDACSIGDPVFVRFTDPGGGLGLGSARTDADTADAVELPGATFMADAGAGDLVPVRVNIS